MAATETVTQQKRVWVKKECHCDLSSATLQEMESLNFIYVNCVIIFIFVSFNYASWLQESITYFADIRYSAQ
jgi:hypothetical protein